MIRFNTRILATASFAAIAVAGLPSLAQAQNAAEQEAVPPSDPALETEEEGDQAIVVTGSRLRRSEFNSPDPVQIINPEIGRQQGLVTTAEILNSSPLASGSLQITSVISNNFVTNGGSGAETIGLRGLGPERTLVLLNGRRAGPAGVQGSVAAFDLNVLPVSIVESYEILKTGASSIYGSDAIAGVINVLTRRSTDGIEVNASGSVPFQGAGETYNVNATYGRDFGRGSFLVTADYFRRQGILRRDRDFLDCEEDFLTFVDGRRADLIDARTGQPACNGTIGNLAIIGQNDFSGPGFSEGLIAPNGETAFIGQYAVGNELDGVCVPINGISPGVVAPANYFGCNFDGPSTGIVNQYGELERGSSVVDDLERWTVFAQGTYEITPSIEVFAEFLYNKRRNYSNGLQQLGFNQYTGNTALPAFLCDDTAFNCNPADPGDPFNTEFAGNFIMSPLVLVESDTEVEIDYYRGVLGLRGDFGGALNGWRWDVYGQYSRSDGRYTQDLIYADSVFTQELRTRSCVGLVTPVRGVPCIDIDFTDPRVLSGNLTAEERAFLLGRETGNTRFEQLSGELAVTGTLFDLPAGSVAVAFGAAIRRDEINDVPGLSSQQGNQLSRASAGITAGRTITSEVFGEIEIPLIHNTRLIENFAITGAGRYTTVNAQRRDGVGDSFSDVTWKVGANWQVTDWLRFRGSWGTSFRAPALFELFLENQTGFQPQQSIDICIDTADRLEQGTITQRIFDNCAADGIPPDFQGATGGATITSGGGIGVLESETSTAKVLSAILTPETRGILWGGMQLSLVVDYFDIEVRDEITTLGAGNIVLGCYNSEFFPDEPLCDLITRSPAGGPGGQNITGITDTFINVNRQQNRGFDVTVRAVQDLRTWGTLTLQGQMTWQVDDTIELFEGTVVSDNGENGDPKWTGNFQLTYNNGPWSALYGLNIIGGTSDAGDLLTTQGAPCRTSLFYPGVPPAEAAAGGRVQFCQDTRLDTTAYHSFSVTRDFGERIRFTLGVANIFDTEPPRATAGSFGNVPSIGRSPVFGSQYDYYGRRVFANMRFRF